MKYKPPKEMTAVGLITEDDLYGRYKRESGGWATTTADPLPQQSWTTSNYYNAADVTNT